MAQTISTTVVPQMEIATIEETMEETVEISTDAITSVADSDTIIFDPSTITTPENTAETHTKPPTQFINTTTGKPMSVVYLQPQKIAPKPGSNLILNPMSQNQSLLLNKTPVFLKNAANASSANKNNTVTYITMLKHVNKGEATAANKIPLGTLTHLKPDNFHLLATNSGSSSTQKFVIAPMPKIASNNRIAVTATTNSVQPKFTLMPVNLQAKPPSKMINLKITDGQVQNDTTSSITVMSCDQNEPSLICNEVLDNEFSYQLSITDDQKPHAVSILKKTTNPNSIRKTDASASKFKPQTTILPHPQQKSLLKTLHTTISDTNTKEVKISGGNIYTQKSNELPKFITSNSILPIQSVDSNTYPVIPLIPQQQPQQPRGGERRRKSHVLARRDFSELEDKVKVKSESVGGVVDEKQQSVVSMVKMEMKQQREREGGHHGMEIKREHDRDTIIEHPHGALEINNREDNSSYDVVKALEWDDGVGSLPGSDLKFQMNEFGFLEYITKDEYRKIYYKRMALAKERDNNNINAITNMQGSEEMRCLECGCYGLPSEFISPKYCSYDCQEKGDKKPNNPDRMKMTKLKRKRKVLLLADSRQDGGNHRGGGGAGGEIREQGQIDARDNRENREGKGGNAIVTNGKNEQENTRNSDEDAEYTRDLFQFPWSCPKKGFSWVKYLSHYNARAAPLRLFKDPFPYQRNAFRPGMRLEGIDPQHPAHFCVLSVAEVRGYRLRVHLDGYADLYDYWLNADSLDIVPAGYCEKHGYNLRPPPGYEDGFSWGRYLRDVRSTAACKQIMANRPQFLPTNFRSGMKLEAVDKKNSNLTCVATVANIMDNRILIHFDSWDDIYDYWADPSSPYIHPVGWCDQYGHNLTPPNDYPHPASFTWERYLRETRSQPAPVRAFKLRPPAAFRAGMRLECVDPRLPQLIRVATVEEVRAHRLRIRFDGWPERYGHWLDEDSTDIHPVGWCAKTGHPIEPPLTPYDVYDFLECATVGCRGLGSTQGPNYATHSSTQHCPYAEHNLDRDRTLPDRLLSPDRHVEEAVPVSREPREKISSSKLHPKPPPKLKTPWQNSPSPPPHPSSIKKPPPLPPTPPTKQQPLSKKYHKKYKPLPPLAANKPSPSATKQPITTNRRRRTISFNVAAAISRQQTPEDRRLWQRNVKALRLSVTKQCLVRQQSNPRGWSDRDVAGFVTGVTPTCSEEVFRRNSIDGGCLLMLSQEDLIEILELKVGPAVKLYNCILLLRKRFPPGSCK